jgi:hypothetical protein
MVITVKLPTVHNVRMAAMRRALVVPALILGLGLQPALAESQKVVTFDELADVAGQPLSGQFPSGVIDWGTDSWYLSGPWQQLEDYSIGFNGGEGLTSHDFALLGTRQLVQLDAYNGGESPTTLTLRCAGQPEVEVQLNVEEIRTVRTGWSGSCNSVTVSTTNGWFTNFEKLIVITP